MGKEILKFGNTEIEKKKILPPGDVDIEKVLVPNKIYFVEKNYEYFIGYLYNRDKVKPLIIMLPKTSA